MVIVTSPNPTRLNQRLERHHAESRGGAPGRVAFGVSVRAQTRSLKQKLTVLRAQMPLQSALHHSAPGHVEAMLSLLQALAEAEVEPVNCRQTPAEVSS